ncbi:rhodanese-like domain-containing protein [Bacteroides sp. 519]|uniref:rhodanese-like domain-containing protein n=1 Tax=Bacteroides sp. 519 TaxID=2302937 RepID=UPI0013D695B9|nr:rhodanese-like domain-containing protein [Bacteroides sp. 519]NDV57242.1 rhodanese-like domain-containing protein [Bacteroides sp. 519]
MNKTILLMAFSLLSLFSCKTEKESFTSLSVEAFAEFIQKEEVQLLDVRTPDEFSEGHIHGAVNIDVNAEGFEQEAIKQLNKEKPVALYCRSGVRSKKAAGILYEKGYKVYELDKGFLSWQSAGNEISK